MNPLLYLIPTSFEETSIVWKILRELKLYIVPYPSVLIPILLNQSFPGFHQESWKIWLRYALPSFVIFTALWLIFSPYILGDFDVAYYPAGRLVLENPSNLYNWKAYGQATINVIGFVNIPIVALLFTLIAWLPLPLAQYIFTFLGVLSTIAAYKFLEVKVGKSSQSKINLIFLFALSGPLFYSIRHGNTTHFLLLLFLLAWQCLQTRKDALGGAILAVIGIIKPPFLILSFFGLLKGRWRVFWGSCSTILAIALSSLLIFGIDLHKNWYYTCIEPFSGKPIAAFNNQSLDGFLSRFLLGGDLLSWQPLTVDLEYRLVRLFFLAIMVGLVIWVCGFLSFKKALKPDLTTNLDLSILICLGLLISPISWYHYYLFLLLPFALLLEGEMGIPTSRSQLYLACLSILLVAPPPVWVLQGNSHLITLIYKALYSYCFFGGMILFILLLFGYFQRLTSARKYLNTYK